MEPGLEVSFRDALDRLLPSQRDDFEGIFAVMQGRPVTIRLLDPPLHEFLPREAGDLDELAERLRISRERVDAIVESLSEANPMLGHRGCRLGITDPEIYEMQVRAIVEAAANARAAGQNPRPEIMIPLVALPAELERLRERIDRVVSEFAPGLSLPIGTMIELPRAALVADRIAAIADFFSFGTNDLTQTTLGLSRDDAAGFLDAYREQGLLQRNPFVALDREGVGQLIEIGVEKGRSIKPAIPIGLCGEHGGEPSSIEFCHRIGLDYVSCSPYRVPTARLAAAQAAIAGP